MAQIKANFNWYGDQLTGAIRKEWLRRLYVALEHLKARVQVNISKPSSDRRSLPGEFPRAETGRLRNSIFYAVDEMAMSGTVGTPLLYGKWLEFGTKGGKIIRPINAKFLSWIAPDGTRVFAKYVKQGPMEPRPYLKPTWVAEISYIKSLFEKVIPQTSLNIKKTGK